MGKRWVLALLLVFPLATVRGKEPKPLPMPPLVSHGQPISNYACVFSEASQVAMVDYWNVMAFAEYGNEHKRYWSKSLGTFRGSEAVTSHNSEIDAKGRGTIFAKQFQWKPFDFTNSYFTAEITWCDGAAHEEIRIVRVENEWKYAISLNDKETGKSLFRCKDTGFPAGGSLPPCFPGTSFSD